jgi:hypothetical protein
LCNTKPEQISLWFIQILWFVVVHLVLLCLFVVVHLNLLLLFIQVDTDLVYLRLMVFYHGSFKIVVTVSVFIMINLNHPFWFVWTIHNSLFLKRFDPVSKGHCVWPHEGVVIQLGLFWFIHCGLFNIFFVVTGNWVYHDVIVFHHGSFRIYISVCIVDWCVSCKHVNWFCQWELQVWPQVRMSWAGGKQDVMKFYFW